MRSSRSAHPTGRRSPTSSDQTIPAAIGTRSYAGAVRSESRRARQAELQRDAALHVASVARRNERALIAADIHDDTIQVFTAAVLRVERLASTLPEDSAE